MLATSDGGCLMNGVSYDKEKAIEEELDIYIIKVNNDGDDPTTIKEAKQKIILKFIPTRSIILLPLFQKKLLHLFFNFTIIPEQ